MSYRSKRILGIVTLVVMALLLASQAFAFKPKFHEEITESALGAISRTVDGRTFRFTDKAIQQIRAADAATDDGAVTNSKPFADPANHFDNEQFSASTARLKSIKEEIIREITDPKNCSGDKARERLGRALHILQDFYSHSNWVELGFTGEDTRFGRSTFSATAGATCPTDPATLDPALSGLSDLTSGYYFGRCGKDDSKLPAGKCYHGVESIFCDNHGGINKDDPGRPNHATAKSIAEKSTQDYVEHILDDPRVAGDVRAIKLLMGLGGSLGVVIDDTGSMGPEISAVKAQVTAIVNGVVGTDKEPADYVLVRYGDPDVGPPVSTTDAGEFLAAVNALRARGGGDCPELLMEAQLQAIAQSCEGSTIFTFTDASAKDASLSNNVNTARRDKKIQLTPLLTGTCSPIDPSIISIAEASGGQLFLLNQSELGRVFDLVEPQLSGDFVTLRRSSGTMAGPREFVIPVDSTITRAVFSVAVDVKGSITLFDPDGDPVDPATDPDVTLTSLSTGWIFTVDAPGPGSWKLSFTGSGGFRMAAQANSPLEFFGFDFVRLENPVHPGYFPIEGEPVAGSEHTVVATLIGPFATADFRLVDETGATLQLIGLFRGDLNAADDKFVGTLDLPTEPFRVVASGIDEEGHAFERLFASRIRLQTVEVLVDPATLVDALVPGTTTTLGFNVRNLGGSGSFRILVTDNERFVARFSPTVLTLDTGESARVEAEVTVPLTAPEGTLVSINATATSLSDPSISNGTNVNLFVGLTNQPPDCSAADGVAIELWPPNHKLVAIDVLAVTGVTDPDGDPVTISVDAVTQDEPVDAVGNGDGNTSPDAIGLGAGVVHVRAERTGGGNGRVYRVAFTASDGRGGSCQAAFGVEVPPNQGGARAVDDGQIFDSTLD